MADEINQAQAVLVASPAPKPAWQSKTLWVALINAVLALALPRVSALIRENPETYSLIVSAVFIGLRFVTKGKVSLV